jgi:hypothetical protein
VNVSPSVRKFRKKKVFSFLSGEARSKAVRKPGYRVRLFHPRGRYPAGLIANSNALYWGAPDLTFMVTWSEPWDWHKRDMPYTEMDWASPQELRLLASILLCECEEGPPTCFYPVHQFSMCLDAQDLNLKSTIIARRIKDSIVRRALHPEMLQGEGAIQNCLNGDYYLLKQSGFEITRQSQFFDKISTEDHLLLRGVGALLKAEMLTTYREFWEEAIVTIFIALEASFQMVLRELRKSGIAEPTSADAARWLHTNFNEPFGHERTERYFQEIYDQRIMTLHPVSRLGINPYAPLFHDVYTMLRRSIPAIFSYLLTGHHSDGHLAAIAQWGKKSEAKCEPND